MYSERINASPPERFDLFDESGGLPYKWDTVSLLVDLERNNCCLGDGYVSCLEPGEPMAELEPVIEKRRSGW